jgi:hypothetical protein
LYRGKAAPVHRRRAESLQRLEVKRNENSDLSVFQLALVAPSAPYQQVDDIAKRMEDALERGNALKSVYSGRDAMFDHITAMYQLNWKLESSAPSGQRFAAP